MTNFLYDIGEISGKSIFIDCTKIEAYANEYTFFGKKAVTKNMGKLLNKIADLVQECEELYGIKLIYKNIVQMKHIKRLRMNISIQAEGSFAQVKQDMNFMCLGQKNVLAERILLAMAQNINKLHNKIPKYRTGKHLFELKKIA